MSSSQKRHSSSVSRIRKHPVTFGNPALGTYKGNVYTLDDSNDVSNRPLVEGAEAVERMVAMVDVPPDQVPEGILNLVRSHRPFIDTVRIVIGEVEQEELLCKQNSKPRLKVDDDELDELERRSRGRLPEAMSFLN